jgi:phage major head subunit gpT-like protein
MSEITDKLLTAAYNAFDLSFQTGLRAAPDPWWSKLAMKRPSSTKQETYAWMAKIAQMKKWVDERTIESIASYGYALVNDDYELTVEVDRNDILDDQYGIYKPIFEDMGFAAAKWPDTQITTLMQTGESLLTYDGQNFFDAAHPKNKFKPGMGTQSNFFTTTALTPSNAMKLRKAGRQLVGEDGLPLGLNHKLIVCGPDLEEMAAYICNANFLGTGSVGGASQVGSTDNFYKGMFESLIIPEWTQTGAWLLLDPSRPVKPFLFQLRQDVQFVQLTNATDQNVVRHKKFLYAADARGAFGFGLWPLALKATP